MSPGVGHARPDTREPREGGCDENGASTTKEVIEGRCQPAAKNCAAELDPLSEYWLGGD